MYLFLLSLVICQLFTAKNTSVQSTHADLVVNTLMISYITYSTIVRFTVSFGILHYSPISSVLQYFLPICSFVSSPLLAQYLKIYL